MSRSREEEYKQFRKNISAAKGKLTRDRNAGINTNSKLYNNLNRALDESTHINARSNISTIRRLNREIETEKAKKYVAGEEGTPINRATLKRLKSIEKKFDKILMKEKQLYENETYMLRSGASDNTVREMNLILAERNKSERTAKNTKSEHNAKRLISQYEKMILNRDKINTKKLNTMRKNMVKIAKSRGSEELAKRISKVSNFQLQRISITSDFVDLFFSYKYKKNESVDVDEDEIEVFNQYLNMLDV